LAGLENAVGKPVSEAIPGIREPRPELFQSYGRVALTGKPEEFEIDFQPLNKWFSISVYSPAREYFVAVFDDITARKRTEQALQESEEKYRRIVDTATAPPSPIDAWRSCWAIPPRSCSGDRWRSSLFPRI
jgi:PAS domain-containing protein